MDSRTGGSDTSALTRPPTRKAASAGSANRAGFSPGKSRPRCCRRWRGEIDSGGLAAASCDSCRDSQPFGVDLLERPASGLECCAPPSEILPALDDDVTVFRIELHRRKGRVWNQHVGHMRTQSRLTCGGNEF